MLNDLLAALEAHDDLPAAEALKAALAGEELVAASLINYPGASELLEYWASDRLEGMHQLKCLAFEASLLQQRAGIDAVQADQQAVLVIHSALAAHPHLQPDALLLNEICRSGGQLGFGQVVKVLGQQAPQLQPSADEKLQAAKSSCRVLEQLSDSPTL
jgi:hypothetical protein